MQTRYLKDRSHAQLEKTINAISVVTEQQIEKRLIELDRLEAILPVVDHELQQYNIAVCSRTGTQLGSKIYNDSVLSDMVAIHGHNRTLELLKLQYIRQTDPCVIYSDPESLHNLSIKSPLKYFMMCMEKIDCYHWELTCMRNHAKFTTDDRIMILHARQCAMNNIECFTEFELPIVIKCNELLRRFLGLHHPEESRIFLMKMRENVQYYTQTTDTMQELYNFLQALLCHILRDWSATRKYSAGLLAQIKADKRGNTAFYTQRRLKALTQDEAAVEDLLGFFKDTPEDQIRLMAKGCETKKTKLQSNDNAPIVLQLSGKQSKTTKAAVNNPFAAMFAKGNKGDK